MRLGIPGNHPNRVVSFTNNITQHDITGTLTLKPLNYDACLGLSVSLFPEPSPRALSLSPWLCSTTHSEAYCSLSLIG